MKKTFLFILSFLFLMSLVFADNMVSNPGFEDWTAGDPDNWTTSGGAITLTENTTNVHGGSSSCDVTWTSTSNQYLRSNVFAVTAGSSITASVWMYDNDVNGRGRLCILYTGASNYYGGYSTDQAIWQEITYPSTVPVGATDAQIELRFYDVSPFAAGTATVLIDDVTYDHPVSGALTISNIIQTPSTDITSSTTVSVSADVTSDNTITSVELHWGLTSGSLGTTITMSNGGSGDTYTTLTDIPAQSDGVTVYYEVYAEDDVPESSTNGEYSYTVRDAATTTIPYSKTFRNDLGACYTYSVSGATKEWYWNFGEYAAMNGYNSHDTEEDWLILPGINLDDYTDENMVFESWYNYGTDDANNYLKLYYSTDYTGIGDPSSARASWTELSFTHPSTNLTWSASGNVDLSGISGSMVYIAFKYHYEDGSYRSWGIDNISITDDGPLPVNLSSFYALYIGGTPTVYWVTQTEIDNEYWNVYRGTNDNFTEAIHLNASDPVSGNGTTNNASEYVYVDMNPVVQNTTYWYWIEDVSTDGETEVHQPITLFIPYEDTENAPVIYGLHQNYPNPFNPSTSISFTLEEESDVELVIYNIKGEKIREYTITNNQTSIVWDGIDQNNQPVSSGVYFYKLITDTEEYQKKMLLVK